MAEFSPIYSDAYAQRYMFKMEYDGVKMEYGFYTYHEMAAFLKAKFPAQFGTIPDSVPLPTDYIDPLPQTHVLR